MVGKGEPIINQNPRQKKNSRFKEVGRARTKGDVHSPYSYNLARGDLKYSRRSKPQSPSRNFSFSKCAESAKVGCQKAAENSGNR